MAFLGLVGTAAGVWVLEVPELSLPLHVLRSPGGDLGQPHPHSAYQAQGPALRQQGWSIKEPGWPFWIFHTQDGAKS